MEGLASRLRDQVLVGLGRKSRWNLKTALDAAQTDGIEVMLQMHVPAKGGELEITLKLIDDDDASEELVKRSKRREVY